MLSRHADSAFWIGRYVERAEATARMIDVHYHFGLESPLVGKALTWESIIAISGQEELFAKTYPNQDEASILQFFAFDDANPNSISNSIKYARLNGRAIRDQISSEMWESLNRFYLEYQGWDVDRVLQESPFEFFAWVKNRSHLFQGITNRTLMMGEARDFHDAGRFLERADQTARILDVKYHDILPKFKGDAVVRDQAAGVGGAVDTHGWISVLKSVGAFEAFRKTHRQGVTPARVSEFLVLDSKFPASVRHCIGRVNDCLRRVSGNKDLSPHNEAERKVGQLYNSLNYMRGEDLIKQGLHESLEKIQDDCADIGQAIRNTYLKY
jgi:uncharacterized alpha-E superfamily protein